MVVVVDEQQPAALDVRLHVRGFARAEAHRQVPRQPEQRVTEDLVACQVDHHTLRRDGQPGVERERVDQVRGHELARVPVARTVARGREHERTGRPPGPPRRRRAARARVGRRQLRQRSAVLHLQLPCRVTDRGGRRRRPHP